MFGGRNCERPAANEHRLRRYIHRGVLWCSCELLVLFTVLAVVGWTVVGVYRLSLLGHSISVKLNRSRVPQTNDLRPYDAPDFSPLSVSVDHGILDVTVDWEGPTNLAVLNNVGPRGLSCYCFFYPPNIQLISLSIWLWVPPLLFAIYPAIFFVRRGRARRRSRRLGVYCDHCNYNLSGNVSGVCPECGTTIPNAAMARIGIEEPAT